MANETEKLELSVERVGDKVLVQLDPRAVAENGSCCNCNSHAVDLAALGAIASEKARPPTVRR